MQQSHYTNGTAAFVNLTEHEMYNGKTTGKYSVTLTLDSDEAESLLHEGIKLRDYKGTPQRKFTSKYPVRVVDSDGETMSASELTWGSKVRVKWNMGNPHPVHGIPPYVSAIKVLELNSLENSDDEF